MPDISVARSRTSGAGAFCTWALSWCHHSPLTLCSSGRLWLPRRAPTSWSSVTAPSPPTTKSTASSASVRLGNAATWPPSSATWAVGSCCLIAVQTAPAPGIANVDALGLWP